MSIFSILTDRPATDADNVPGSQSFRLFPSRLPNNKVGDKRAKVTVFDLAMAGLSTSQQPTTGASAIL